MQRNLYLHLTYALTRVPAAKHAHVQMVGA